MRLAVANPALFRGHPTAGVSRAVAVVVVVVTLGGARAAHADVAVDGPPPSDDESAVPAPDARDQHKASPSKLDALLDDAFAGRWLDPKDEYWRPRRGQRLELGAFLGGEAAFSAVEAATKLPSIGGMVLTGVGRYYPVDRLAVVFGGRTYLGLDGVPAAGTTASSVISLITGIRYDLVREVRFSLLWDLYSGPSLYVFADLPSATTTAVAIGGEMGSALALRYSVGPLTGEARGVIGARAGASSTPFQRAGDAGPFSALYAGVDIGLTWSYQ